MQAGCTDLRTEQRQLASDFSRQRRQQRRRGMVKARIRHDRVAHVLQTTTRKVRTLSCVVLHLPARSKACLWGEVRQLRQRFCSQGVQQLCTGLPVCTKHTTESGPKCRLFSMLSLRTLSVCCHAASISAHVWTAETTSAPRVEKALQHSMSKPLSCLYGEIRNEGRHDKHQHNGRTRLCWTNSAQ